LQKVVDFLAIRPRHARTLLIHHRWNVESLFGKLAEEGTNKIFLEAGLPPPEDLCNQPTACETSFISCGACLDDAPQNKATRMDCGHAFCNECKHLFSGFHYHLLPMWHQSFICRILVQIHMLNCEPRRKFLVWKRFSVSFAMMTEDFPITCFKCCCIE
jgi:hypothetical protein